MNKKILYTLILIFFTTSCAETFDSVKRGVTGAKKKSTDEFLIQKKDPLTLPPDFENLPTPDERVSATEEISVFKKTLQTTIEDDTPSSSSAEQSILDKIKKQ